MKQPLVKLCLTSGTKYWASSCFWPIVKFCSCCSLKTSKKRFICLTNTGNLQQECEIYKYGVNNSGPLTFKKIETLYKATLIVMELKYGNDKYYRIIFFFLKIYDCCLSTTQWTFVHVRRTSVPFTRSVTDSKVPLKNSIDSDCLQIWPVAFCSHE